MGVTLLTGSTEITRGGLSPGTVTSERESPTEADAADGPVAAETFTPTQ